MKMIDVYQYPCVLCPKTHSIVSRRGCEQCEYFYGYNGSGTKIGCEYENKEDVNHE